MNYQGAVKGIKKLFLGEILGIIAAVLEIASLLYLAMHNYSVNTPGSVIRESLQASGLTVPFVVFSIGGILLFLISYIITLAGLVNGSHDEGNFKRALWIELVLIAVAIASGLLRDSSPDAVRWLNIVSTAAQLAVSLLVLTGIGRIAESLGKRDVTEICDKSQKWLIRAYVLSAVFELILVLFFRNDAVPAMVFLLVIFVLDIVAYVVYLRALAKARNMR